MRSISPSPGCSILITSAPKSPSIMAAVGAAITEAQSITFKSEKIVSMSTQDSATLNTFGLLICGVLAQRLYLAFYLTKLLFSMP